MFLATTMIVFSIQIITTSLLLVPSTASSAHGFTIDLIHRSTNSSTSRLSVNQLGSFPYADTVFDSSEYLMKLHIGTPPFEIEAVLDTGSDLLWTQCRPCLNCYRQRAPIFDPLKSSTYKDMKRDSAEPSRLYNYEAIYADGSYSKGTYARETVTIKSTSGQPFVMPETVIGCGHNNSGLRSTASGIVGLNLGSLSLVSQMGDRHQNAFSYCFAGKGTSKINFGGNAIVAGEGTVSTTMFKKMEKPGFYFLNLDAVSVGDTRVETLGTPFFALDGNIVIDSGTTYTYLPRSYCNQVKEAVDNVMTVDRVSFSRDMLCYSTNTIEVFPVITVHFSGGADLVLDKYNMYVGLRGVYCLAIMCVDRSEDAIFGNRAQNNLLVGYDTSSQLVSFKSTDCSATWS